MTWARTRSASLVALLGLLTALACGDAGHEEAFEPPADGRAFRVERLRQQVAAFRDRTFPEWQPWFESLREFDRENRIGQDGFLFGQRKERVLYNPDAVRRIEGFPVGGDLAEVRSPLVAIADFARQLREHGIDFLLLPVPPRAAVYPDATGLETPLEPGDVPPLLDGYLRELYLRFEEHGVEVVDLLPVFLGERYQEWREELPEGLGTYVETPFRRQDVHWSTYGSRLAARELGARIREYPWYAESVRVFGRARLESETRWVRNYGSIARAMRRRGELPPEYPPEQFPKRRVRPVGEAWSVDDPESPVLLLGDSFSETGMGLPEYLLEELGYRVARITLSMGGQSGQLKLLRMEGGLEGKRLVVWEVFAPAFAGVRKWVATDVFASAKPAETNAGG